MYNKRCSDDVDNNHERDDDNDDVMKTMIGTQTMNTFTVKLCSISVLTGVSLWFTVSLILARILAPSASVTLPEKIKYIIKEWSYYCHS